MLYYSVLIHVDVDVDPDLHLVLAVRLPIANLPQHDPAEPEPGKTQS